MHGQTMEKRNRIGKREARVRGLPSVVSTQQKNLLPTVDTNEHRWEMGLSNPNEFTNQ
jgi:hypothetical protein